MLSVLLIAATTQLSQAADYTKVGVNVGTTADYSISAPTLGTVTATGRLEVTAISGTEVTVSLTVTYSNGTTSSPSIYSGDISVDVIDYPLVFAVVPGLNQGDIIYLGAGAPAITSQDSESIAGETRTINHLVVSTGGYTFYWKWDKDTGILVGLTFTHYDQSMSFSMISTSLWGTDALIILLIGVGVIIAVVAVVVVVFLVRRRSRGGRGAETGGVQMKGTQ